MEWEFELRWEATIEAFRDLENRAMIDRVWLAPRLDTVQELENGAWREEWEEIQVDPFDGYSLFALFLEPEPAKDEDDWEWQAEPAIWHRVNDEDPLEDTTLGLLFQGEEVQQGPDLLNPQILFAQFREETIDTIAGDLYVFHECIDVPAEEGIDHPQRYIIDESLP